jgi:hypothetical protein
MFHYTSVPFHTSPVTQFNEDHSEYHKEYRLLVYP